MIPREIYTLGAVQFDTRQLANLQGQLMAKKAAKDEAVEKYLFDLQGKIPAGQVRAIDRSAFQQKVAEWTKAGIEAKGKTGAQQQILAGFQDLLADANESKAAGERQQKIAELKLQDKIDEDDFPIIDSMSKSIYDPSFYKKPDIRQPYTIEDFSANIPSWDIGKRKQFIDFAVSGVKPAGKANVQSSYDKPSFTTTTTYEEIFTPRQIQDVSQKAIAVLSDKQGLKTYKDILKEGEQQVPSDQFIQLAKAYELVTPGDIMDTPLKVAKAEIALGMLGAKESKKETTFDRAAYAKYQSGLIASRGRGGAGADLYDYDILGKYTPEEIDIVKEGATKEERVGVPSEIVYQADIPSEDLELITNKGDVSPIIEKGRKPYFKVRSDGNWEGARGQVIDKVSVARANLDKTSLTEERRIRQGIVAKKDNIYEIKGKPYSEAQLLNLGYTKDQIGKAVAAGVVKIKK